MNSQMNAGLLVLVTLVSSITIASSGKVPQTDYEAINQYKEKLKGVEMDRKGEYVAMHLAACLTEVYPDLTRSANNMANVNSQEYKFVKELFDKGKKGFLDSLMIVDEKSMKPKDFYSRVEHNFFHTVQRFIGESKNHCKNHIQTLIPLMESVPHLKDSFIVSRQLLQVRVCQALVDHVFTQDSINALRYNARKCNREKQ